MGVAQGWAQMNNANALGFVLFGLVMWLLPQLAPQWFPAGALDGSSTRALWTQTMAVVQGAVGCAFLIRHGFVPVLSRWLVLAQSATAAPLVATAAGREEVGAEPSEQGALIAARALEADGVVTLRRQHAPLRRALKVAFLNEERLVHFLERLRLLAHRHRDRAHAHGAAPVIFRHHAKHALVHLIQAGRIDFEQLKRRAGHLLRDPAFGPLLREVADEVDQVVGNARRAA